MIARRVRVRVCTGMNVNVTTTTTNFKATTTTIHPSVRSKHGDCYVIILQYIYIVYLVALIVSYEAIDTQ